jgi:hypothetical protein
MWIHHDATRLVTVHAARANSNSSAVTLEGERDEMTVLQ